jgi:hypothetical protein
MIVILGLALAGLPTPAEQGGEYIVSRHDISPKYNRTDYESACGSAVFRVRFRNGPDDHGRVDQVWIDGRPVVGAAEQLQIRAARRPIDSIELMNCGLDSERPAFRGVMNLSKASSQVARLRPMLFFRITRQGREGWRLTTDD